MREWRDDATIVVVPMDPQLEEIVKQIADAVEKRFSRRFDEFDARFDEVNGRLDAFDARFDDVNGRLDAFDARLDARFSDAEGRLAARFSDAEGRLAARFSDAEGRLAARFADAEKRLADGAEAHMDELRTLVTLSAEGYGATVESIERRLTSLEKKVDNGFRDHGKILREHSIQLKALTRQQTRRRSPRG